MSESRGYAWLGVVPILLLGWFFVGAIAVKNGPLALAYFGPVPMVAAVLYYITFGRR